MSETPSPKPIALQWVEALAALAKAIFWPILAIVILVWFREPIGHAATSLSRSFDSADNFELSTKGLKWNIEHSASRIGGPELAKQLRSITPNALRFLLALPQGYQVPFSAYPTKKPTTFSLLLSRTDIDALRELKKFELVTYDVNIDEWISWWSQTFEYDDPTNPESSAYKLRLGKENPLNPGGDYYIFRSQYRVTEEGKRARIALIDAVAANLTEKQVLKSSPKGKPASSG